MVVSPARHGSCPFPEERSAMIDEERIEMTRGERKHRRARRTQVVSAVIVVFLLGTCAMAANASVNPRIASNTYVAGVDVGGLTRWEASERIATALAWPDRKIALKWTAAGGGAETVSLDRLGLRADIEGTLKDIPTVLLWGQSSPRRDVPLRVTLDAGKVDEVLARIRAAVDAKASDARLVIGRDDKIQIVEGVAGKAVNVGRFRDSLLGNGKWSAIPAMIELPVDDVEPGATGDHLRKLGINELIAAYSTTVNNDRDRTDNIRLAAARLDDYLLAPGQEFSFNDVVGPRTAEDGYKETPVYWRDEVRTGFGGGVCQLSTTLYNVALLAGLEIVERHPHSLTVDYVPLGRDAAVSFGEVDLKFRNSTPNHIMVKSYVEGGKVYVKMYGDTGTDQKVAIKAHVLKKMDFETETIEDPTLSKGQVKVRNGKPGFVVRSERIIYVDGDPVKTEVLGVSSYYPLKKQVKLGPGAVAPGQTPVQAQTPAATPQPSTTQPAQAPGPSLPPGV